MGALGLVISGAGPTLCAVSDSEITAKAVTQALESVYMSAEIDCDVRYTRVDKVGARIISIE